MDQALAVLDELSSRVHSLFTDALEGSRVLSALREFAAAVEWKEPLVLTIIASHVLLLALAVTTRGNQAVQLSVLLFCFGLVRGGERLNALAARKFEEFFPASSSSLPRRTNYFAGDKGGVFWSALVSAPLLLVMAVQLVLFLRQSWLLMIDLKVAQLRAAARQRREAAAGNEAAAAGTATTTQSAKKKNKKKAF